LSGLKISIIVNDPDIVSILEVKQGRGEKTDFINKALRFYIDNTMDKVDDVNKFIVTDEVESVNLRRNDSLGRIADSLETIVDLLNNKSPQINSQEVPQSTEEEQHELELPGTDLSRRFSTLIGKTLKANDW
jgi:hypothetical protein